MEKIQHCRVCNESLFATPLLAFSNMPKAAQHLPTLNELAHERGAPLTVCQCSKCGLVQLTEPPVPYFRDVIRAAAVSQVLKETKRQQFSEFIQNYDLQGKKLLEIGCGKGEFLSIFEGVGVKALGLENAVDSITACRAQGLNVVQGYLDTAHQKIPDAPFDAFALLMFMEHMPDPNSVLAGIHNNLADNGVGIVEVPNFDMVIENSLFSEFIADHLFYFTHDTLVFTLQKNGFEVLELDVLRDNYVLSATVRKRPPLKLTGFQAAQTRICSELHQYIEGFPSNSVAIWGAGHQTLAMISLADIGKDIKYIVDSAPFKQGKYSPATHIPIVPPETLDTHPVAALIIMAASYSDEVAAIVQKRFGDRLPVAILRETSLEILNHQGPAPI